MSSEKQINSTMEVDHQQAKPILKASLTTQDQMVLAKSPIKPQFSAPTAAAITNNAAVADDDNNHDQDGPIDGNYDDQYFLDFPAGYRFCPLDGELIVDYLMKKVTGQPLPKNRIAEVNLYRHNPENLAEQYKKYGDKEWYFFTPRDRKYRNGTRPNRAAGDGYWKATGADKAIQFNGATVGYRKALVFYQGKPPRGDKTNWIMHEYRVNKPPRSRRGANDMRLDDWVLCRIYKKADRCVKTRHNEDDPSTVQQDDINEMTGEGDADYDHYNAAVVDSMGYLNNNTNFADHHYMNHSPLQNRGIPVTEISHYPPFQNRRIPLTEIPRHLSFQNRGIPVSIPEVPHHQAPQNIRIPVSENSHQFGNGSVALQINHDGAAASGLKMVEPLCSFRPAVGPAMNHSSSENIFRSKYLMENSMVPKPIGFQEEMWNIASLDCDFASQFDFYNGSYIDPLINGDDILPSGYLNNLP